MPTLATVFLGKPTQAGEFQLICEDVAPYILNDNKHMYKLYGVNGQLQNGVDIRSEDKIIFDTGIVLENETNGKRIYIQCKDYLGNCSPEKFLKEIKSDREKAIRCFPDLEKFVVMTSLDGTRVSPDGKTRKYNDLIATEWKDQKERPIVFYWEDIQRVVADQPELLKRHYSSLFFSTEAESNPVSGNYFFNPTNNTIKNGKVTFNPKYIRFMNDGMGNVSVVAEVFICNGLDTPIKSLNVKSLSFEGENELICEVCFPKPLTDSAGKEIMIDSGQHTVHTFQFDGYGLKSLSFTIPSKIVCKWCAEFEYLN